MPQNVDRRKIMQTLNTIVNDDTKNNISVDFTVGNFKNKNTQYMELLYPDPKTNNFYVYSPTNSEGLLFTSLLSNLDLTNENVLENGLRVYMWDTAIISESVVPTEEFEKTKYVPYNNDINNIKCALDLKATVSMDTPPNYEVMNITRSNNYIWYPGTIVYCLVDGNSNSIYAMQSLNNTNTGSTPLSAYNAEYVSKLIELPTGWKFLCCQLSNEQTLVIYSSSKKTANLVIDSLSNSYQYVDPEYNEFLYNNFISSTN